MAPACLVMGTAGAVPVCETGWRLPAGCVFPHVVVAGFYPGGVVHDPVHDGVGVGAASESLVPVLLGVLGGEQGAAGVVSAFHELEQEAAEAFLGRVEQPFDRARGPCTRCSV